MALVEVPISMPIVSGEAELLEENHIPQEFVIQLINEKLEVVERGGLQVVGSESPPAPPILANSALSLPDKINKPIKVEPMSSHQRLVPLELHTLEGHLTKRVKGW